MRKYEEVQCPTCGATPGQGCVSLSQHPYEMLVKHKARRMLSQDEQEPGSPQGEAQV